MATFEKIKLAYEEYYNSLPKKVWDTEKGIFGATPLENVYKFLKEYNLKEKKFLDLGSGDGVVVALASLFCESVGIEYDSELHTIAISMKENLELDNAQFICGDFFEYDFSSYDVIFINPDNDFSKGLNEKLLNEMKNDAVLLVYNIVHKPTGFVKGRKFWLGNVPVTPYTKK